MRTITLFLLLTLCMFFTACVGGGVIHNKSDHYEKFEFTSYSSRDFKVITESTKENNPSKEEIIAQWGEPDQIKEENEITIWIYETDTRWAGAVPMIGIGVPLAVPTGKNTTEFHFRESEESPYLAIVNYTSWSGGYYGPGDESSMESGFHKLED